MQNTVDIGIIVLIETVIHRIRLDVSIKKESCITIN